MHPEKGRILGPFTKFKEQPRLRKLTLDVAAVLLQDAETTDPLKTAVDEAVDDAVKDSEDAEYWHTLLRSSWASCWTSK